MRIILMRHGKPALQTQIAVSSLEFGHWISVFNSAAICESHRPSKEAIDAAQSCNAVVCSDLARSLSSARLLGVNDIHSSEHQLREMDLPWGIVPFIQLKPQYWTVIFRVLWFLGYSSHCETFKEAKRRAEQAAMMIEGIAKEKGSVLFVGHGLLNQFIARALIKRGWRITKRLSSEYWGLGILEADSQR